MSVWSSDKAVVPCLKYANQLFSHRFTGTRHLSIQLDTMSFTNPEKKGRCARHKTLEGAQSIPPAFLRCSHRTHPTPLLVNAHRVQRKRGYSFDSQRKRCRVGHSENPCSHAKKSNGRGTNTATLLPWGSPRRRLAKHPCNLSPSHPRCTGCTCSSSTAPRFGSAR